MTYKKAFLFYLIAFILQPVIDKLLPFVGGFLSLTLAITIVFTLLYDETLPGLFFGPVFGLLEDILYSQYIGPGALAIAVTGIIIFILREHINTDNKSTAVICLLIGSFIKLTVVWIVYSVVGSPYSYMFALRTLPREMIFNVVFGMVLYVVLQRKIIKHRRDRYFR